MPSAAPLLGPRGHPGSRSHRPKKKSPSDASVPSFTSIMSRASAGNKKKILSRMSSKISKVMRKKSKDNRSPGSKMALPLSKATRRKPSGSKEPQPKQPPTRSDTAGSTRHASSSGGSPAPGNNDNKRSPEDVIESVNFPEINTSEEQRQNLGQGASKYQEEFVSLEPERCINKSTRLSPLTFDEAEGANPFRTEDAGRVLPAARSREDHFSLHLVLSPSYSTGSSDVCYKKFKEALGAASGRSAFDACKSPPAPVEEGWDCLDDSDHSIPSLGLEASSHAQTTSAPISEVPRGATHKGETADSALVWGCLSALLGAPAPEVVKAPRRRKPVNLWLDDSDGGDLDDIELLPDDHLEDGGEDSSDQCSIPSLGPQQEQLDDDAIPDIDDDLQFAASAPPATKASEKEIADSTLAWSALAAILGSPAPSSAIGKSVAKERIDLWGDDAGPDLLPEIDEDSLPGGESDSIGMPSIDLNGEDRNHGSDLIDSFVDEETKNKESADSTLVWGALGALLGSPAPKFLSSKNTRASREVTKNLWNDGGATGDGDFDAIPSMDEDGTGSISSPSDEHLEDGIPDIVESFSASTSSNSLQSGTCDDEEGSFGPLTLVASMSASFDGSVTPSKRVLSSKDLTDSALSFPECSPKPKVDLPPKRKTGPRDLWV